MLRFGFGYFYSLTLALPAIADVGLSSANRAATDPLRSIEYSQFWYYWMHARIWKLAAIVGLLVGLVISVAMTFVDWWFNPANLFHNESGTDWTIVGETALSWLGPVALVTFLATVVVSYSIAWIRSR